MLSSIGLGYMAEIRTGSGVLIEDSDATVSCFPLTHGDAPCAGYRFSVGGGWHLCPEALDRCGVPEGPLRRRLALGETVVLADGRTVLPADVRGDRRTALSAALSGDCALWEELAERTQGTTLLVGEATYLDRDRGLARKNGHITARELARAGLRAESTWLVATHLSQRYTREDYLSELHQVFPRAVLAEDCLSIGLTPAGELLQGPYHEIRTP